MDLERAAAFGGRAAVFRPYAEAIMEEYEGDGVAVTAVEQGYPAEVAGIKVGDVIEQVDGRRVRGLEQLKSMISSGRPGEVVVLDVWRTDLESGESGRRLIEVVLGRLDPIMSSLAAQRLRDLGLVELATSTPDRAQDAGVEFQSGVIVLDSDPRSQIGQVFPRGSILLEAGGRPIASYDELLARLDRLLVRLSRRQGSIPIVGVRPDGERVALDLGS